MTLNKLKKHRDRLGERGESSSAPEFKWLSSTLNHDITEALTKRLLGLEVARGRGWSLILDLDEKPTKACAVAAYIGLSRLFDAMGSGSDFTKTVIFIGKELAVECRLRTMKEKDPDLFKEVQRGQFTDACRARLNKTQYDMYAAKHGAEPLPGTTTTWASAGAIVLDAILAVTDLIEVRRVKKGKKQQRLVQLSKSGLAYLNNSWNFLALKRSRSFLTSPPEAWVEDGKMDQLGGYHFLPMTLVRSSQGRKTTLCPRHIRAANLLQFTPFTIYDNDVVEVKHHWRHKEFKLLELPEPWPNMTEHDWKNLRRERAFIYNENRRITSKLTRQAIEFRDARDLAQEHMAYAPVSCDFRGRFYYSGSLHPQSSKAVRRLLTHPDMPRKAGDPGNFTTLEEYAEATAKANGTFLQYHDFNQSAFQIIAALTSDSDLAAATGLLGTPTDLYTEVLRATGYEATVDRDTAKLVMMMIPYGGSERGMVDAAFPQFWKTGKGAYRRAKRFVRTVVAHMETQFPGVTAMRRFCEEAAGSGDPAAGIQVGGNTIDGRYFKADAEYLTVLSCGSRKNRVKVGSFKPTDKLDKRKMIRATMANLIHACDAVIARETILSAEESGLSIYSVHDSFCTPEEPDAAPGCMRQGFIAWLKEAEKISVFGRPLTGEFAILHPANVTNDPFAITSKE